MPAALQPLIEIVNSPRSAIARIRDPLASLDLMLQALRSLLGRSGRSRTSERRPEDEPEARDEADDGKNGGHDQATGPLVISRSTALMPVRAIN